MTKNKDTTANTETAQGRVRPQRKKVYERIRESQIPEELVEHFKRDNYDLKLVRWSLNGEEDYRYLNRREREGYEFVSPEEIPQEFMRSMRVLDTKTQLGLVTVGDLCLMKVDSDLRNSRRKAYQEDTDREVNAVDVHVLEKKGFRNLGTKSKVYMKEPTFQD